MTQNNKKTDLMLLETKIQRYIVEFISQDGQGSEENTCSRERRCQLHPGSFVADSAIRSPRSGDDQRRMVSWIPPLIGSCKLNCDATWNPRMQRGGIGWILRDWNGCPLRAGYKSVIHRWKISWLEAFSICEALHEIPLDSPHFQIETDALQVVRLLSNVSEDATELEGFINEAQALMEPLQVVSINHTSRLHNGMAHFLAHKACELNESGVWAAEFPFWLLDFNYLDSGYDYHTCSTLLGASGSS